MAKKKPAKTPIKKVKPLYRTILHIGSEARIGEFTSENFGAAVEWCIDYARRNKGCKAEVYVEIEMSPIHNHAYALFQCSYPRLDEWQLNELKARFTEIPYE